MDGADLAVRAVHGDLAAERDDLLRLRVPDVKAQHERDIRVVFGHSRADGLVLRAGVAGLRVRIVRPLERPRLRTPPDHRAEPLQQVREHLQLVLAADGREDGLDLLVREGQASPRSGFGG